ncbi:exonuclease SbcCD subunit D [Candidatus Woesearchaeota archaeon]|nr:exonuclease SbcCD subunit D [Candidatus Woesearchaeota archaeon]
MFRYAHLADVHIGGWRDPRMKDLSTIAFAKAMDKIMEEQLDFILISGDVFNTALPAIDKVKDVTKKLREVKDKGIPIYILAGSHDFSPSGKTMLDVLEHAGLWKNVVRGQVVDGLLKLSFTIDPKTGAKITGMLGRKGMLDKVYYENLLRGPLETEPGYKIFMFHTALSEFKPKEMELMEAHPLSLLPKGFDYYAGGHVHYIFSKQEPDYGLITYPGPLFPNNFGELEKLSCGGFYIVTAAEKTTIDYVPIRLHPVVAVTVKADYSTPAVLTRHIMQEVDKHNVQDALVLVRVEGMLTGGGAQAVAFEEVFDSLYKRSAYFVMKNTHMLTSQEFEEVKLDAHVDMEKVIAEHVGKSPLFPSDEEKKLITTLLQTLSLEKEDGESLNDFQDRVIKDAKGVLPFQE